MQFRIISCEMLEKYLSANTNLLIDLRTKEEYDKEHIANAIWYDWEKLEDNISVILAEYTISPEWIILYCEHGNTSLLIARDLARNGYPVISVNGGYTYWKRYKNLNQNHAYDKIFL